MSTLITYTYLFICIALPIYYLIIYPRNVKKPNWVKAITISLSIFIVLISIKLIVYFLNLNSLNCYLNNICNKELTTTTEVINTTKTTTSTTTKKIDEKYPKIEEIKGTKKTVGKTAKGYTIEEINGITYIDGYLIANKTYKLPSSYIPIDTHEDASEYIHNQCNECINNTAYKAWIDMKNDALKDGIDLFILSGYRSYTVQTDLYQYYVDRDGSDKADRTSARPGSSEHQTSYAFDINMSSYGFNNSKEAKWLNDNAYKYGYILRYPENKEELTGYDYESWHYRYVGSNLAKTLYNNGNWITLEEYFGITSKYQN